MSENGIANEMSVHAGPVALDSPGVIPAHPCNVGGCVEASEATITIAGSPLRMCGDHARQIEGALERRQQA